MKTKLIVLLIIVLTLVGLGITISVQHNKIQNLKEEVEIATNNNKAYELENETLKGKSVEFQYTIKQLNSSKDSLIQKINSVKKDLKIKNNKIQQLEYIASKSFKKDSIVIKDTVFIEAFKLDTLIGDEWASANLKLEYPNQISVNYTFNNETVIIANKERVTVDPPKKCCIARWFQKKQDIITVEVIQLNPYCENKEQKFIKIVK